MLESGQIKVAKEESYGAKKPIKIWHVNLDNMVILKLLETKNNSKYLSRYLGEDTRPLVLILLKVSGYVKTFKLFLP